MQDQARQRLKIIATHLGSNASGIGIEELQRLLEHDNWENRAQLKELMKDELYVP